MAHRYAGTFLQPGESGPQVSSGNSAQSRLIHLVAGTDPDSIMPKKGTRLTPEQVGLLRAWIDQGMVWPADVTFAKPPDRNLHPRPGLPASAETNPLDRLLATYFQRHGLSAPAVVEDRLFLRRASLDITGLLPTPEELAAFESDSTPDKRTRKVAQLLSENGRYAQHWLTFGTISSETTTRAQATSTEVGNRSARGSMRRSGTTNPMTSSSGNWSIPQGQQGFTRGIVWRSTVNASMTPPMQARKTSDRSSWA